MRTRFYTPVFSALISLTCLAAGCGGDEPQDDRSVTVVTAGAGSAGTGVAAGGGASGTGAIGRGASGTGVTTPAIGGTGAPPPVVPPRAGTGAPVPPPPTAAGTGAPPPVVPPRAGAAAPPPAAGAAAPPPVDTPAMSAGCGKTMFPASARMSMDVAGLKREYIVKLPAGYDPNKPYKLVFAWHFLGGSAQGIAGGFGGGYYGLESMSGGSAIFVAPEGIDAAWPNSGGRDVNFAKQMVEFMRTNYCIDNKRIFSVGFSYGAIMSNTVGCQMGDVFRAIAPMSGSGPLSAAGCKGPVAAWLNHGTADNIVAFSGGQRSRDTWVTKNGCMTQTMPTQPSPCVAYQGCKEGYPVVWCEQAGSGHVQPSYGGSAIWKFFSQF